jgi:hypothetical protein
LDWPSQPKTVFHNDYPGEGLSIIHQRREMRAASNQPGHVKFMVPSIAGKTNTQNASACWTHLCHSRYVVDHADHLWNSSQIADSSARCSSTQRRACLKTLLGASPASKSPFDDGRISGKSVRIHVPTRVNPISADLY